jgi:hypothetical protein
MQQRRLAKSNGLDGSPVKVGSLAAGASSTKKTPWEISVPF